MAENELAEKLKRQCDRNEGNNENFSPTMKVFNPYTEFKELTRKEILNYEKQFKRYDVNKNNKLGIEELKIMMEKLGAPQTHLALKEMIKELDEDMDGKINFREFLLLFRKALNGELKVESGLHQLYSQLIEIDVQKEGVKGAKMFFETQALKLESENNLEKEIKEEQEEKRRIEIENKKKHDEFLAKKSVFNQ